MSDTTISIPDREWFKPADVCVIAALQPYVLRSWEKEFPTLGVTKAGNATRSYRRSDVELVLRIKQLVFGEGLTLAGVRRRLEAELPQPEEPAEAPVTRSASAEAQKALADIKSELKTILAILDGKPARTSKSGWPRPKGQPTLLDLAPDQHDNGGAVVADEGGIVEARPAARRSRRSAAPPAE